MHDLGGVARADPSESAAVLIGVSRYRSDFPDVPQAIACVRRLATQFTAMDVWGLRRPSRLYELVDPDRAAVLQTVGDAARLVRPPGLLVIYFVGHAESYGDQLCLATSDGDRSRPVASMVTVADLVGEVARNGVRDASTVLLLDCCFAGRADRAVPVRAVPAARAAGWYFIGAADSMTTAPKGPGQELTPFTAMLLRVILGLPDKGVSLRGVDVFDGLTALLPDNPPVHNNASPGRLPWLVNLGYQTSTFAPATREAAIARPSQHHYDGGAASDQPSKTTPSNTNTISVAYDEGVKEDEREQGVSNLPPRNPHFLGRDDLIRDLFAKVLTKSKVALSALRGMGGVGKTQLAIEFAHRYKGHFTAMWWFDAEQPSLLRNQYAALAERLNLGDAPVLASSVSPAELIRVVCAELTRRGPSLLIYDNAEDPQALRSYLPAGDVNLLVTSRHRAWSGLSAAVDVDLMTRSEAVALLSSRGRNVAPTTADAIAELLGDLPLAVEQAAAYLENTGLPPDDYLGLLRGRAEHLLSRGRAFGHADTVATVWAASMNRLKHEHPAAVQLLTLCAFLAPKPIALTIFSIDYRSLPKPLGDCVPDPLWFADEVGALTTWSLVRRDGHAIIVHRLLQAAVRRQLTDDERRTIWSYTSHLVSTSVRAVGGESTDVSKKMHWQRLIPHVAELERLDPDTSTKESVIDRLDHSEPIAANHLAPPSDDRPAPRMHDSASWNRATDLHWRGQLHEAEEAYREIVDARAHALGWDHPDTLTARDQHSTVLRDLDRLAEALVECDEVLTARMRILGDDHPDTLTSRSHLANVYHHLGDLTRSEVEHQRVLEARIRVLGANHQETLITRSNLAKVHQDRGELDRAIEEHNTVMRARARLLGAEHRDTLMSRSLLASALHHAGRLAEAEAEHRSVLGSRLRLLGPVHLDTAVSRHRLASVLHDLGRLDEAVTEYRAAQSVYSQLLGPSSPFARAAVSDLQLAERALRGGVAG